MHCWSRNEFFSAQAFLRPTLYTSAPEGWRKDNESLREFYILAPVDFAYYAYYLRRDSSTGRRLHEVFWTIAASKMMVFTILAVLDPTYRVHIYSLFILLLKNQQNPAKTVPFA